MFIKLDRGNKKLSTLGFTFLGKRNEHLQEEDMFNSALETLEALEEAQITKKQKNSKDPQDPSDMNLTGRFIKLGIG